MFGSAVQHQQPANAGSNNNNNKVMYDDLIIYITHTRDETRWGDTDDNEDEDDHDDINSNSKLLDADSHPNAK
jgi:hypothetical protein